MKIAVAQFNFMVGDIDGNQEKILQAMRDAWKASADILIFSELCLTGYPADDLLLRADFLENAQQSLEKIKIQSNNMITIVGAPIVVRKKLYNAALVLQNKKQMASYYKHQLPNYGVFDEKRYFYPGKNLTIFTVKEKIVGVLICEDIWLPQPLQKLASMQLEILIVINASPYSLTKDQQRKKILQAQAKKYGIDIFYVNQVGGQDDLLFDGGSLWINARGHIHWHAPFFKEALIVLNTDEPPPITMAEENSVAILYEGLCLAVRDYVKKNGFHRVILGLSGGIDSALVLAIAVDALGAAAVSTVMMPFHYTSHESKNDAKALAQNLKVAYQEIPIHDLYDVYTKALTHLNPVESSRDSVSLTWQNLQARIRANLLMAMSNHQQALLLSTSNKSEIAVGYATLYGDMAGAFSVLKDVPKTWVYRLARYRQQKNAIFPEWILTRPPSAELAPNQRDEDQLVAYEILDKIIELYIDENRPIAEIIATGIEAAVVTKIIRLIHVSEYKRRQAPPGPKITELAFGRERRFPLSVRYPATMR